MAKNKYEISLWEDIFVPESSQGNDYVPGHYEEEKIVIIGSDTMTAQCKAIEPKLVRNINGKVTFTFKMYYRYHDDKTGEDYDNPFLKLLVNERKVKVNWQDEWYDLIIKNIQESTSNKTVIYTCEDANINELAKSGFDIIFDDDLTLNNVSGSNQGTAQELVARTLEGTDWVLGESDTVQQFTEEAVFEVNLIRALPAIDMQTSTTVTIPAKIDDVATKILIYYPQLADFINNLDTSSSTTISPLYLAYDPKQKYLKLAQTEMLVQADCYKIESCECAIQENVLTFSVNGNVFGRVEYNDISTQYRARRLVYEPVSQIEPISGKSCYVHTVTMVDPSGQYADQVSVGDTVYESIGSEFGDALFATNLIANGASFITTTGWEAPTETPITLTVYPTTAESAGNRSVFLTLPKTTGTARYYYNDAIRANSQYFQDDCRQGETYRIRMKVKRAVGSAYDYCDTSNLQIYPMVAQWEYNTTIGSKYPKDTQYFDVSSAIAEQDNWIRFDLTCINTFTGSDIYRYGIGLFICQPTNTESKYIEEIQFFKIVKDSNGTVILPGELNKTGIINNVYTYFTIKNNDIHYLYQSTEDWNKQGITLKQKYNDNFSKIRAINIKQSNRFNILQTIAETFECWIKFKVEHDPETGKIIYDEHGAPRKEVSIKNEIGEDRGIGFVYGIDLQSISRTVESSQIVTKTIVLENNNEFGEDGTCRISRSEFNYPQIDYILNFDYYINHGLIDGADLNRDLYGRHGTPEDTRGFYSNLHEWNIEFARCAEENAKYAIALNKDKGLVNVYTTAIEAAGNELREQKSWVTNMAGMLTYEQQETQEFIATYINSSPDIKGHVAAIEAQTQLITFYSSQVEKLQIAIEEYERKIAQNQASMDQLQEYIKAKTKLFNKKYARFISEGSWTDQKYYDDNLYYLDANSVAYTSSRPKVSYNISVMRLSGLEDFKFKDFSLGDISYVEDTDFFGYTYLLKDNRKIKTPYREKVVITEITYNLDEPSKDSFQVQNYRTQFEDLFQRITAQTQSLQYTEGAYNKVSNIIESNGTIKESVLASSVRANNNALNRSALNNSVVTDESGITVTNIANATEQVKITSGGIFITTNGGETWNNAIRGDGVGTQYLSSGAIDTKKITILGENRDSEEAVAFKWDENGITAYDSFSISPSSGQMYDRDRYVRFYKEGVSVQTTTSQGFPYEKVKLGRLNSNNEYGLQINSCDENHQITPVFKATDDGNLSVTGNITATSLTIVPGVTISSNKIQNGDETLNDTISRLDEADGEAIVSDVLHYLATDRNSGVTIDDQRWSTEVQQISSTDRYLWTYHTYTYGNGNTSNTTPIITGVYGEMGTTISSIQYNTGTSATQVPTGEWSNNPVSVSEGQYLWTRTTYSDGSVAYSVARQGEDGGTAVSIASVKNYYLATNLSSGVTKETTGWDDKVQQMTAEKQYLWNYEEVLNTTGGVISSTNPVIIGRYGQDGKDGHEGEDGRGIVSITEHYQVSNSNTTPPQTWSDQVVNTTTTNRYLWNYETITYTDNTSEDTAKRVIGTHGATGTSITSVVNYYLATDAASGISKDDKRWTAAIQEISEQNPYLWNYEEVKSGNTVINSSDPCIIGRYGKDGYEGKDGRGIVSITEHYQVSASNSAAPSSWSDTMVNTTTVNKYLWNYETITYTDGSNEDSTKRVIGTHGETGTRGATWYAGTKIDGTSTTAQTFPQSGITSAMVGDHYLNTTTQNVYICTVGGDASSAKWKFESNIKGTDGAPGSPGHDGKTAYFHVKYSDDGGQSFTPAQGTTPAGETPGAWIGTYTDNNATDSTSVSSYTWIKIEGHDGDSVEVQSVEYAYQLSTSGTEIPSGTWSTTPVAPTTTQFAWTRTTTTFTDGKIATTYTVGGKTGTNGSRGATWYAGTGITGTSTTPTIYSGSGVSSAIVGDHYLNTSTQNVYRCTTKGAASVAKWVYEQNIKGADGAPGEPGNNGKTAYFHVKYSNDGGQSFTPAQGSTPAGETPGSWIGTYTDNTEADSGSVSSYKWVKIEGEDGQDGEDGKDGVSPTITTSKSGKTTTIQITDADGTKTATVVDGSDGAPATVYYLQTSTYSIVKNAAGTLNPTKVTFSAKSKTGTSNPSNYTGRLVIEESADGSTWTTKYDNDAASKEHGPDAASKLIRCSLYLAGGKTTLLDQMTVAIISDGAKGADGITVTSKSVTYQVGNDGTSVPSGEWQSSVPAVADGKYLWTKTEVNYSDNTSTIAYSVSYKAANGQNGKSPTVTSTQIRYAQSTSGTSHPDTESDWIETPPAVIAGRYMWTRTIVTYSDNATSTSYSVAYNGTNGQPGTNGYNQATLYLYQRSSSAVTTKPLARTYTFSTGTLSSANDKWTRDIPSGTDPCYVTSVSVSSKVDQINIAQNSWASIIKLVQNGTNGSPGTPGSPGANGFNSVTIQLYQRAASAPTTKPGTLTYTFATGALTGTFNNWQTEIPADNGKPCYIISATVLAEATQATDTIASSEWTTPIQLVISGEDGKDAYTIILSNESHTFAGGTSAAIAGSTECQIIAYKGATQVAASIGNISGQPTGMEVTSSGSGTTSAKITIAVTNQMTTKNGVLTIPITVDGHSFTKEFTYSLALTGAKGAKGDKGAAGVSSTGLFMRVNSSTFTNTSAGKCYFHGYNSENVAADVNGWVMWNGAKLTITKGMWINPQTSVPYNKTILHVYRTSGASEAAKHCDVWWDDTIAKWRGFNYTGSSTTPSTVSDWIWNEVTDCILATYVKPSSGGSITSAQLFDPPKKFSEIPDPTTQNDRTRYQQPIKAESAITAGNIIVGTSTGYHHLTKEDSSFDLAYPILYANSSIATGSTGNDNYLVVPFTVTTTQSLTLTAYKSVYIKGTIAGNTFVPVSTEPLTQTEPTSEDGYSYILLGTAYNATSMYLVMEHPIFTFANGAFQSMIGLASQASTQANSAKADAAQAQQTADGAQNTANEALTSATKAQTDAESALASITDLQSGLGVLQLSTDQISQIVQSLSSDFGNLNNYVSIDSNGIAIRATNSDFGIYITAGDIQFRKGNATLAQFAGEQFIIDKGTLITELNIRPFVWMVRSNGHLSLVYRGQEE